MPALDRKLIQSLPAFSAMDNAELDDVISRATALRIPRGSAVFEQGETAKAFYVLLNGRLKVVKVTSDGQQVVIRFVVPGDIYGIAKALNREDYPATATALVDSVTLAWDMAIWDDFMARHPSFARNVMQMMGQRIQEAHTRLKELATQDVEHRVAHAVLRLVSQSGRKVDGGVLVDFRVTRQEIAEISGTTMHSVSRILSAWENAGLVVVGRQKVIVCDLDRLSRIAEGTAAVPRGS
jgi:CRP/FNR family transcriptional regulator, nitrogen oxide reductase regulator